MLTSDQDSIKYRIALLACYFGPLPPYAPLVFRSMEMNPSIDWLFITDTIPRFQLPPNVHIRVRSLQSVADRCGEICEFPIIINRPYDICDLRPAFGLIFSDELKDYHFWGHVDMDAIYGDILRFLPNQILAANDRILCRGHLSIYRNIDRVNHAFKLLAPGAMDHKKAFTDTSLEQFDEWRGIWKIMRYHNFKQYHEEFIADIRPPSQYKITRFEAEELENYKHQFFYWHDGRTFQAYYHREGGLFDREVAYIHFKKRQLPAPEFEAGKIRGFSIGPDGFFPYNRENLTEEQMDFINSTRWKTLNTGLQRLKYIFKKILTIYN